MKVQVIKGEFKIENETLEKLLLSEFFTLESIPVIFLSLKDNEVFEFIPIISTGALSDETVELTEPDLQKRIEKIQFIQKTINYCINGNFFYIIKTKNNEDWEIGLISSIFFSRPHPTTTTTPTDTSIDTLTIFPTHQTQNQNDNNNQIHKPEEAYKIAENKEIPQTKFYPATPKQLNFLKSLLKKCGLSEFVIEELTKNIDKTTATKTIDLIKQEKTDEAINLLQSRSKQQPQQQPQSSFEPDFDESNPDTSNSLPFDRFDIPENNPENNFVDW